jgi:hypothetical protein
MEPDLQGGAGREGEEAWAGEAVRAPAEGLEGRAGQERAPAWEGNACARNAGRLFLTRPECPVIR